MRNDVDLLTNLVIYVLLLDCWDQEPHERPTFMSIINKLGEIATSPFVSTPHESFHTMQEDWRLEIEQMFDELRLREKVGDQIPCKYKSLINYNSNHHPS